jgi:hypothetical protein
MQGLLFIGLTLLLVLPIVVQEVYSESKEQDKKKGFFSNLGDSIKSATKEKIDGFTSKTKEQLSNIGTKLKSGLDSFKSSTSAKINGVSEKTLAEIEKAKKTGDEKIVKQARQKGIDQLTKIQRDATDYLEGQKRKLPSETRFIIDAITTNIKASIDEKIRMIKMASEYVR